MSDKKKILYVDDDSFNLEIFKINLSDFYEVYVADNALIGLDILAEIKDIRVVVSDMKMPIMNGLEFINKIKEKYPQLKCFLFSGYDLNIETQKALDSGLILDYFRKPFNLMEINQAITKVIN